jgi:FixJ family two-component response regulator
VFVVDDDDDVRRAFDRLLRAAGYAVTAFPSASAYLAQAAAPPPGSCLVLDVRMPGLSGLELQQAIRDTPRAVPIVFVTGDGEDVREEALRGGAVDVLSKPVDAGALLEVIARAGCPRPPR